MKKGWDDKIIEGDFTTQPTADDPDGETIVEEELKERKPEPETIKLIPIIQTCLLKTKHGKNVECKFWVHTEKYFQYYEPGYQLEDMGDGKFIIRGDTVLVPDHEIQYMIIRNAASAMPEQMFLALGGKKRKIIDVSGIII